MTTTTMHPLAASYVDRLDRAARRLPRAERRELVEEISAHLSEATDPGMSDAEIKAVLARLGDPEDIVAAHWPEEPSRPDRRATHEWAAIFLLLFGGFLLIVGWIAGAILLWTSRAWSTRDKLIGTLIIPGGLASALIVAVLTGTKRKCLSATGRPTVCTPGPSTAHSILEITLFALCIIGPIFTSVYLARRAR
jgi:hypothetical protein